ncbi:hypothetical protein AtNW77_Chr5g0088071 [Arabidopsis thaliana]
MTVSYEDNKNPEKWDNVIKCLAKVEVLVIVSVLWFPSYHDHRGDVRNICRLIFVCDFNFFSGREYTNQLMMNVMLIKKLPKFIRRLLLTPCS